MMSNSSTSIVSITANEQPSPGLRRRGLRGVTRAPQGASSGRRVDALTASNGRHAIRIESSTEGWARAFLPRTMLGVYGQSSIGHARTRSRARARSRGAIAASSITRRPPILYPSITPVATRARTRAEFRPSRSAVVFKKRFVLGRAWSKYSDEPLKQQLQTAFGADTTFGSHSPRTGLLCVLQNSSTDSPWPLSNCTMATYNQPGDGNNLDWPLWQIVRASAAAPTYFPPETIKIDGKDTRFQDGGITPYNNPAYIQFVMATAVPYNLRWPVGPDQLLSVSVGTGSADAVSEKWNHWRNFIYPNARNVVSFSMNSASVEQDRLCRLHGDCRFGATIDSEFGPAVGGDRAYPALFIYVRYDTDISDTGLANSGMGPLNGKAIRKLDAVDQYDAYRRIGAKTAESVSLDHLAGFL